MIVALVALAALGIFCIGVLCGAGMVSACVREHVALCDLTDAHSEGITPGAEEVIPL